MRRDRIGFVFQAFNLIPTLTRVENIRLPFTLAGREPDEAWLDEVSPPSAWATGSTTARTSSPAASSSASRWRVRSPRARRSCSPTSRPGNLDSRSGAEILGFLRRAVDDLGQTVAMVTHDPVAASYADAVVFLADGRVVDHMPAPTAERVLDRIKDLGG